MPNQTIIFLRTAWMKHYQGVSEDDIPSGAGSVVEEFKDGGEVYNFLKIKGNYYGYSHMQGGRNRNINRLGAKNSDDYITGVTVVFFAKNPETAGQYIVGWYKDATLYRKLQYARGNARKEHPEYCSVTTVENGTLIPADDRIFEIPDDGPGQTNAWYVMEYSNQKYLNEVWKYLEDPNKWILRRPKRKPGSAYQQDAELRKKIELAAMKKVSEWFSLRGYQIDEVDKENLGWDMEASKGNQTLLLEIKGLRNSLKMVELTPNEYKNSKTNRKHYRICIVSNALSEAGQTLDIFFYANNRWRTNDGKTLQPKELVSARFELI